MAIANNPAARATALLTPEATPEWRCSTELITAVVRGATTMAMPRLMTMMAGK